MTEGKFTISVDVPEPMLCQLAAKGNREGKTVAQMANEAIALYLSQPAPETIDQMLTRVSIE
jgi:urease gamma subunit